jgi:hypothetical protein
LLKYFLKGKEFFKVNSNDVICKSQCPINCIYKV